MRLREIKMLSFVDDVFYSPPPTNHPPPKLVPISLIETMFEPISNIFGNHGGHSRSLVVIGGQTLD